MKQIPFKNRRMSPAATCLQTVLQPFLKSETVVLQDVDLPGSPGAVRADLLLVGEFETLALTFGQIDHRGLVDWSPAYPLGLMTQILSLPATSLFHHLDDFAYLVSELSPSLFIAGAQAALRKRARREVQAIDFERNPATVSIAYPSYLRDDLEIQQTTRVHADRGNSTVIERAA